MSSTHDCPQSQVKRYNEGTSSCNFDTFEDYHSIMFGTWMVRLPEDATANNWLTSTCTCPACMKKSVCKHVAGCCAIKMIRIPLEAKTVEIGKPTR